MDMRKHTDARIHTHAQTHTHAHMHMHAHVASVMGFANFTASLATLPPPCHCLLTYYLCLDQHIMLTWFQI